MSIFKNLKKGSRKYQIILEWRGGDELMKWLKTTNKVEEIRFNHGLIMEFKKIKHKLIIKEKKDASSGIQEKKKGVVKK